MGNNYTDNLVSPSKRSFDIRELSSWKNDSIVFLTSTQIWVHWCGFVEGAAFCDTDRTLFKE